MKPSWTYFLTATFCLMLAATGRADNTKYDVVHYDEYNGLAQRWATQIVEGDDGYVWIATWNGLDRFDGYGFVNFKSTTVAGASLPSDRISYMWKMSNGNLLCLVDDRLAIFDTHSYQFSSPLATLERRTGKAYQVETVSTGADGTVWVKCWDGQVLSFSASDPQATATERKGSQFRGSSIYGAKHFVSLPGHDMREAEYCMTDHGGNLWYRSNYGIYKATPYTDQFSLFTLPAQTQVRGLFRDSRGRVWVSGRESKFLLLVDGNGSLVGYLRPDGRLQKSYTEFGHAVYSFCEQPDGTVWLGSKPDGLFKLMPVGGGNYSVSNYKCQPVDGSENSNSIYQLAIDRRGRMWVATFSAGLLCFDRATGRFTRPPHYPADINRTRDILITPDNRLLLASMRGLVVADISKANLNDIKFTVHKHEPDRPTSLSNEATMSVYRAADGSIYVCTESGGINKITSSDLLSPQLDFDHIDTRHGFPSDIVLCMFNDGHSTWAVCNHLLVRMVAPGKYETYDANFFHHRFRYSDARPVPLGHGRWLFGLIDGAATFDLASIHKSQFKPRVVVTGYSVEKGQTEWMPQGKDTITLSPSQRNVNLSFAALDYAAPDRIEYAYKLDDGHWSYIGHNHTASLVDLNPGTYKLQVKATNHDGVWTGQILTATIIVKPKLWETTLAKVIYVLLAALIVLGATLLIRYIRNISIRNRNLEAYLRLADSTMAAKPDAAEADTHVLDTARVLASDDAFMRRVLAFVEANVGNAEAGVNDMAEAAATSRANLNRKMKAILGVSPKEFLQEVRMQKACRMLDDKHAQVNDVAFACGFADPRYFSRVFKAKTGLTPTEYRNKN